MGSLSASYADAVFFLLKENSLSTGGTSATLMKTWYTSLTGAYDT